MIGGVNFQPGTSEADQMKRREQTGSAQGVQEAIKVLSLRLPKVVGAQAVSPQALLQSQGGQGNSRVDSIVESVMRKMFPTTQSSPAPAAPMYPVEQSQGSAPSFGTAPSFNGSQGPLARRQDDTLSVQTMMPRIVADNPFVEAPSTIGPGVKWPNMPSVDGGGYGGMEFGNIAEPSPDLRSFFDWLPDQPAPPREQPLI